jgi:NAD-dependent DNA ligase
MSLEGHTFVLTGKFTVTKKKLIERIEANGGVVAPSFNKKVKVMTKIEFTPPGHPSPASRSERKSIS